MPKLTKRFVDTLTEQEQNAVARFGDAVLGNKNPVRQVGDDNLKMYDSLLDSYKDMTREQALVQLKGHPNLPQYEKLDLPELRIRVAREHMKALAQNRAASKPS